MALQCNISLNVLSIPAGQAAQATLTVYNPNAVAVVVTAVNINSRAVNSPTCCSGGVLLGSVPAIGQGMLVSVPALSSINIGPFPIVGTSSASVNAFQSVNQTGNLNPVNPQGSQPSPVTVMIGADVYGSDGSFNVAGQAGLIVGPAVSSPPGYQGGYLNMSAGTNLLTFLTGLA